MAVAGQNTRRPPARPENYCESKQTYFSYFSREIEWAVFTETAS